MRGPRRDVSSRRDFLAAAGGAVTLAAGVASPAVGAKGANERIGIGLIGVGGRGTDHLEAILKVASAHNVEIRSVCDVWRRAGDVAAEKVKKASGREPRACTRFGELLDDKGVDAIVVATPDFGHGAILTAALAAGKDAYIEKPMTIDVDSAARAVALAKEKSRVVQVGTQRRSDGHFRAGMKAVAAGEIGPVNRASAAVAFNEPRWRRATSDVHEKDVDWDAYLLGLPRRPFDPKLLRMWQLYKETSNGMPGLWMTHFADAVHMLTGATVPASAVALGGIYVWKDGREHADTFHAILEYPQGFLFDWGMGLGNAAGGHFTIHGTKATLDADRWHVRREKGSQGPHSLKPEATASHMENWLDCLRSRKPTNAPIETGYQHVVATVMAAKALETGRRQAYDAGKKVIVAC
ncbi:putative oxidoreductase YdgJ [Aquisphaera giovannonii]|uniref:Putative oxidoreductase YdgJ n=1 Tax=Aquisphaera giovannonii TaxID=406548 RepID=A0A5B9VVF1_9BACT|nr:Gfo/Idh/MocA family oxidoreductase [Aquisphaera giovannonii]QEH32129.1 putative oxidoreductase YdgJ [Aquisphaera giovannonii]